MKKTTLLKSMLLLCALVVGSTCAWADYETITFSTLGYSNGDLVSSVSGTNINIDFTDGSTATAYYTTGTGIRIYGGGSATFTAGTGTVTKVELTFSGDSYAPSDASNWSTKGKTSATSGASATWEGSATSVSLSRPTGSGHWRMQSVKVTYTPGAKTDPTITFNDGGVRVGKTLDLSTLFTSNSTGAVTYSITTGDSYASIDGSVLTGVAVGSVTVQASQASYGAYNAKAVTATISVTDPALSSIAITNAPTKTTYDEGDLFDAEGMVVTATFADASEEDVTASCTWIPSGALTTSDTEVTISYTYKDVTKTATQDITVNAYVQPTQFDIALNNSLFGTSYDGTASGITDDAPVSGKTNKVNVIYAGSSNHYINDSQIRFYPDNKLTFEAPTGYIITKIVFTSDGTWTATISSDKGTYTSGTKTWTGWASSVLFTGSGSGQCRMSKAAITLATTVAITPGKPYTTYVTPCALDFDSTDKLTAYIATGATSSAVSMESVKKVPAGTPIVLKATETGSAIAVNVAATTDDVSSNKLLASDGVSTIGGDGVYDYILSNGKFYHASEGVLPAGKCYLHLVAAPAANELTMDFGEGDVTAINKVEAAKQNVGEFYNLAGQRVAQPTKGLYIVNGKKVVLK